MLAFRAIIFGYPPKSLIAIFSDRRYDILSVFFTSDIPLFRAELNDGFDAVLGKKEKEKEIQCKYCNLQIRKDKTDIQCKINGIPVAFPCSFGTDELYRACLKWEDNLDYFTLHKELLQEGEQYV